MKNGKSGQRETFRMKSDETKTRLPVENLRRPTRNSRLLRCTSSTVRVLSLPSSNKRFVVIRLQTAQFADNIISLHTPKRERRCRRFGQHRKNENSSNTEAISFHSISERKKVISDIVRCVAVIPTLTYDERKPLKRFPTFRTLCSHFAKATRGTGSKNINRLFSHQIDQNFGKQEKLNQAI